jgi:hypothetical protein
VLAETCAIADADATEADQFIDSHVEMLRINAADQYERLIAIQRPLQRRRRATLEAATSLRRRALAARPIVFGRHGATNARLG